jgi:CRP/FNR family transcriptional regulator
MIGATPEALSRAMKRLSDEGLLTVQGRVISILDVEGLKGIAEEGYRSVRS